MLGAQFIPLVLKTYCNVGAAFYDFLELFHRISPAGGLNTDLEQEFFLKQRLKQLWIGKISVCLQRANARLILSKSSRTQQVAQKV